MKAAGNAKLVIAGLLLGAAVAVLVLGLVGRSGKTALDTQVPAPLLPETTGALGDVVMHYVPQTDRMLEEPYTDFLRAVGSDVTVAFVVPEGLSAADRSLLDRRIEAIDPSGALARRVRVVPSPGPITPWSKDRALVTQAPAAGTAAWLLASAEPDRSRWPERYNDWLTVRSIAQSSSGRYQAKAAPFDYDAGDFAVDGDRVIVDTNLLAKNRHRGIADAAELGRRLRAWLGMPVLVLGREPGDTPRHHLAMYMTPLRDKVVLVGDPRAARALVGEGFAPGEVSSETAEPLRADFSEPTIARFELAASELARNGYRVERVPNVPFDDKTYVSYTNGVFETRDGVAIAYVPVYGIPPLDDAALGIYRRLGWEVRPVRVRSVYPHHGTIGCLVNVLSRR
jgi:hypothetical protein